MSKQRKRHTLEQIVRKLGQADRLLGEGNTIADVCRELGVPRSVTVPRSSTLDLAPIS